MQVILYRFGIKREKKIMDDILPRRITHKQCILGHVYKLFNTCITKCQL